MERPIPKENPLASLVCNIVLPAVILYKFSSPERLGPVYGLVAALSLPLGYSLYDFVRRRKASGIAILGFVSVLLTGGFGLMKLDGIWFAVKEASIPGLIGIAVVASLKTRYPLVRTLLYNEKVIDVPRVDNELTARGNREEFDRLLVMTTWILAASFVVSAALNFVLAVMLLKSPAGSEAFNQELAQMTMLSYPVIVVPSMIVTLVALWRLLSGIKKLTGLNLESIFKPETK
jgi:hypothetical protein